jgi:VWFA-related protein
MRLLAIALALFFQLDETIEVSIVNVDVHVTDRSGKFVRGLTKDDFEVFEDGKRVEITNFAEYVETPRSTDAALVAEQPRAATAPLVSEAPHQKRTIVVFVDRFHMSPTKSDPIFENLKAMLHRTVRPGDAVSVVAWVHRLYTRLPFTDDLNAIDRAIDEVSKGHAFGFDPDQLDIQAAREFEAQADATIASGPSSARGSGQASAPSSSSAVPLDALTAATQELNDLAAKTAALSALLQSMSGSAGQKSMICAMRRWSMVAGLEYLRAPRTGGRGATSGASSVYGTERFRQRVEQAANAAGVALYMLYPAGLGDDWVQRADNKAMPGVTDAALAAHAYAMLQNETPALMHTAEVTGGMAAWGAGDVIKLLPAIENDLTSYYSLAYRATGGARNGAAHRIVVKAKNPAYRVRARQEVVTESDVTRMKARVAGALVGVPEQVRIPLQVNAGKPVAKGRQWEVPLTVYIPIASLTTLPENGKQRGAFTVYIASSDAAGAMSEITGKTQPFDVSDAQRAQNAAFSYRVTVVTDREAQHIAVGVFDELSREWGLQRIAVPR